MLQLIRDRSQGLVVGVIVFFISLTFALFGVQQYLDARGSVVVAEVNGEEIGLVEYQRAFQQLRQRAQAMLGEEFDPDQWSGAEARLSALEFVVNEHLLLQVVDDANIRASDAQIANYVRSSTQFHQDGVFSKNRYLQIVRGLGFSELGFEQQVRKDIVTNQLRAGIGASAFTTVDELQVLEQYRQQSRDIGFAILGIESFREGTAPTREETEAFFSEQSERYRVEEKVSVAYLELSIESLMQDIPIDESYLRAYYDANQANYVAQEQRNVNHILVQVPREATAEEVETARTKAVGLRELASAGDSFEEIAKENSDDIGSRTDGGETGFFGRGVMAPEFEEAAFAMSEQEISEPIKTEFGFHILRLKEIKPGGLKPFEDARPDVEVSYRREQAEALFFEQAEQLSELVYEQPDSLRSAADVLGLAIKESDSLGRSELAVIFSSRVVEAAFEPEVLIERLNSEPVELRDGRIVVIRVLEHEPSSVPSLDDILDNVTKDLIDTRAREAVHASGKALVERLNNGEDLQTVVASAELTWENSANATRNSSKLNRAILRAAFRTEQGLGAEELYTGVPIGTGDYGVIGVSNVVIPPIEELNISDISQLRRDLASESATTSWQDFVALIKSDSDIESFPHRL